MPRPVSQAEFRAMLEDSTVPDELIAAYLCPSNNRGGFNPTFRPDPELVEQDQFKSAMTIGNWWCRWRRRARFNRRLAAGVSLPVIVSEGDSWFQFPFVIKDVIDHLGSDYLIWSNGAAGDTADNMLLNNSEYMTALDEQADKVSAFLLSAAGNDVIGQDESGVPVLASLLYKRTASRRTADELINTAALGKVMGKLKRAYLKVISDVRSDGRFTTLPILVHGYDYALPFPHSNNDLRDPYWAANDEWLGAPMKDKGIMEHAVRIEIVERLIQTLYRMLCNIATTNPNVHVVDVRGTLTRVRHWADEIHGTSAGFRLIAAKFRQVLNKVVVPKPAEALEAAFETEISAGESVPPFEAPLLHIESYSGEHLDSNRLGFGDLGRFALGFRRAATKVSRGSSPEAAIDEDDSVPYRFLRAGSERGRAVCKIEASGLNFRGRSGHWFGTGFLVAPNILLTNHHVINSREVAARSQAVFDYHEIAPGKLAATTTYKFNPDRLFVASPFEELDYCFVWIDGRPDDRFGIIEFWRGSFIGAAGTSANIIHHPDGKPKRISLEKNEIINLGLEEILVHYASDTEPGSSGSPVMNDDWRLFALHHASSRKLNPRLRKIVSDAGYDSAVLNEGIKTAAIAIDVDSKASDGPDKAMARQIQKHIMGTDSRTGFFGTLGRSVRGAGGMEVVVDSYRGSPKDIDIAFWNIEWFNRTYRRKMSDVARIVADLNLDIWAFVETSPEATEALVETMLHEFDLAFDYAASEPAASSGKQTTTVMWNRRTVSGRRLDWPPEVDKIFRLRSDDRDARRFEAVEGKLFDRYPGLFRFEAIDVDPGEHAFDFNLVPVHLKAKGEGSKRRRMASNVLAAGIGVASQGDTAENDWIIGGDFNAELATGQFDALKDAGFTAMSAQDERGGAITYLGQRHRSLIDSIFLSPGLSLGTGPNDFMIISPDRADPGYIERVSDHRPVMVRLSIRESPANGNHRDGSGAGSIDGPGDERLLQSFLREFRADPPRILDELAALLRGR